MTIEFVHPTRCRRSSASACERARLFWASAPSAGDAPVFGDDGEPLPIWPPHGQ